MSIKINLENFVMDSNEFDWDAYYSDVNFQAGPGSNRNQGISSSRLNDLTNNMPAQAAIENYTEAAPRLDPESAMRLVNEHMASLSASGDERGQGPVNPSGSHSSQSRRSGLRNLGQCVVSSPVYPIQTRDGVGVFIAGLTVVAGQQGSGKSTIIRKIIADISNPSDVTTFVAEGGNPSKAVVVSKEDDENSVFSPEVIANGGHPRNVDFFTEEEWGPNWLEVIEDHLKQNPECKILLVDTIEAFAAKFGYSKISAKIVRQFLDPLSALGRRYRVAIVATCHLTKRLAPHVLDRIAGSVELTGSARLVYTVTPHSRNVAQRVLQAAKSNQRGHLEKLVYQTEVISLEEGIRFARNLGICVDDDLAHDTFVRVNIVSDQDEEWQGESNPAEESSPATANRRESEARRCANWIQSLLTERNAAIATNELNELAATNGFSPSTVTNARTILRNENLVNSSRRDGRCWLELRRIENPPGVNHPAAPNPQPAPSDAMPNPTGSSGFTSRNRRCIIL